jgi:hypothetical protein
MQTVVGLDITHGECIEIRRSKMKTELIETGALIVRAHKGTPFYEAKWRDGRKRQRKRRLGRAWLEPDPRGGWKRRRRRVCRGYLDERAAYREMARVIAEVEGEQQTTMSSADRTAPHSIAQPSAAASSVPKNKPVSECAASTICATPSAVWRSSSSTSSRSRT